MSIANISDVTFIIPVRLETSDRIINFYSSLTWLLTVTNANIIIAEQDVLELVPEILKQHQLFIENKHRIKYMFYENKKDDVIFYRTFLLNEMLLEVKTPIVVNYDCDIILPTSSYLQAAEMCRKDYDLVYPFGFGNNQQLRVTLTKEDWQNLLDTHDVKNLHGFSWNTRFGFCQFFKTKSYINGYCENENLIAWAPDDEERYERFNKLGYKIGRINDLVYHLEHMRSNNSTNMNPFFMKNEQLFENLKKMNKQELIEYYSNQEYYKKFSHLIQNQ